MYIPEKTVAYGFVTEGLGAHSSRTIMLRELRLLLASCSATADLEGYRSAILTENVLLKRTEATRKESFRRLRELYGLTPDWLIFRALRDLWDHQSEAQPLLALLCAVARDPVLMATVPVILNAPEGTHVTPQMISRTVDVHFQGRLNATTLANIGRHAASSWKQSGHLRGHSQKIRVRTQSYPTTTAYALLLGYLCGERGNALFHTPWVQLLDTPLHMLHEQAMTASQLGWLEYRHAGEVTEITFRHLLREKRRE